MVVEENKYYDTKQTLHLAAKNGIIITKVTLLVWIKKNKLGFQLGGLGSKWYIHKDKFNKFIKGEKDNGST